VLLDRRLGRLSDIALGQATAVCRSPATVNAAYDLLVALCKDSVENMALLSQTLTEMFYQGNCCFRL